jgi:hypothetical protein
LICLHRRKKARKDGVHEAPSAPPAELVVTRFPYEMSTTDTNKYVPTHERSSPNELPAYSGHTSIQHRPMNYNHTPSHDSHASQAYGHMAPHSAEPYGSPQEATFDETHHSSLRSPNNAGVCSPSDHATYNDQQGCPPQQAFTRELQYFHPTPTSPNAEDTHSRIQAFVSDTATPAQFYVHPVPLGVPHPDERSTWDGKNGIHS